MRFLKFTLFGWAAVLFASCQDNLVKNSGETSLHQYEDYLKNAVYSGFNQEGEDSFQTRLRHIEFYTIVAGDRNIAGIIYDESLKFHIEPELAFALVFSESRFNPRAVNANNDSVDRGLFQLNSKSFPDISASDFFKPEVNIPRGIAYLRYCLDMGRNEVSALAMYNAGPNRVRDNRTPSMTLDYIAKIQQYKNNLAQGVIPEEFGLSLVSIPNIKTVKNLTFLMDQNSTIN